MQNNTFSGLIIGQNIITIDRVASTNDYFKENLSNFKPQDEGTAILAVEQFAGKGQRGNIWLSEPGKNIITSILLYPRFLKIQQQFALSCAISLGLLKWLKTKTEKKVQIKWPNDIYIDNEKIAGILIENSIKGNNLSNSIVGIGININQTRFVKGSAITSLKSIDKSNTTFDILTLAKELYAFLDNEYKQLNLARHADQLIEFNQNLFRKNEIKKFIFEEKEVDGKIIQVLHNGLLQIQIHEEIRELNLKEIRYVL
ncbi:biotin--[acetyl-CoA-carboxylase] ligase [Sphingobacterium sp. SRCM116780]|uniref:biotin--[acetyl-CoA-carboxylase] ligase n=1 Tax=Sphingobacterium sp. SRCM116780 TaxID=2907623 RepID=UPI001F1B993D|nr:biotin--[acetyl-CoA-carboxylase] ligase [Sphingobacterium sp. SRCM116780]UIR55892.1 biotin--[acetyl-CoA-carboxylase] ligase [Sphingobacterium sp. SRCM116780]